MNSTTLAAGEQRPPRIPHGPQRQLVFRAVNAIRHRKFNGDKKNVLREVLHLDQKRDGCYASAEAIGDRLGLSTRFVEDTRREWKACGFLISQERIGHRNDAWYVTLPFPLPQLTVNPTVEQVHALRDQIHLAINSPTPPRTSVAYSPTPPRRSHIKSTEPSTELSTEPRTEPTEVIREEVSLDVLETFKKKWRAEKQRWPTAEEIVNHAPAGWDG